MNQQLIAYISDQLQAGLSYNDIETALLGVGWDATEVKQALASVASQQTQSGATPVVDQQIPVGNTENAQSAETMPAQQPSENSVQSASSEVVPPANQASDTSALASVVGEAAVSRSVASSVNPASVPATKPQNEPQVQSTPTQQPSAQPNEPAQPPAQPIISQPQPADQPEPVYQAPSQSVQSPQPFNNQPAQAYTQPDPSQVQPQPSQPVDPYSGQATMSQPIISQTQTAQPAYAQQPVQPYQSPQIQPYPTNGTPGGYYGQPTGYSQKTKLAGGGLFGFLNKKIIIAIIVGVVFLVLVLIVAIFLSGGNKKNSTNTNNNDNSQNTTNSLLEAQPFTSERGGFSINPPKGWHPQELTSTNDVVVVISKETNDKSQISSMTITSSTIADAQAATTNLDSFVNFYKTATAQSNPQTKINSDQKITIDGVEARLLDVDTVNESIKVTGYMVYIIKDKKLYQIQAFTYDVTPNSESKRAMRSSIDSFKFVSGQSTPSVSTSPTATAKP